MDVLAAVAAGGIRPITYHVLLLSVLVAAWRFGDRLTREATTTWAIACLLSDVASARNLHGFTQVEPVLLTIDVITLILIVRLTLREPQRWLTCAAAFQLIAVSSHFVMGGGPGVGRWVYQIFVYGAGWGTLVALIWGQDETATARRAAAERYLRTSSSTQRPRTPTNWQTS